MVAISKYSFCLMMMLYYCLTTIDNYISLRELALTSRAPLITSGTVINPPTPKHHFFPVPMTEQKPRISGHSGLPPCYTFWPREGMAPAGKRARLSTTLSSGSLLVGLHGKAERVRMAGKVTCPPFIMDETQTSEVSRRPRQHREGGHERGTSLAA